MRQEFKELRRGVAAERIVRRDRRPFRQLLRVRHSGRMGTADDRVMHALAGGAERRRDPQLRVGGQRGGFAVRMHTQHAEVAHHFLYRIGAGGGFGIEQDFAAIGIHQFARNAGGFLRLALAVAVDRLDLPPQQAARCVDAVDLHLDGALGRGAEQGDRTGEDRLDADLDRVGLGARHERHGERTGGAGEQRATPDGWGGCLGHFISSFNRRVIGSESPTGQSDLSA